MTKYKLSHDINLNGVSLVTWGPIMSIGKEKNWGLHDKNQLLTEILGHFEADFLRDYGIFL